MSLVGLSVASWHSWKKQVRSSINLPDLPTKGTQSSTFVSTKYV